MSEDPAQFQRPLTSVLSAAGGQGTQVDVVASDEASLLVYRQLAQLDQDPPGLMVQHQHTGTRHWP